MESYLEVGDLWWTTYSDATTVRVKILLFLSVFDRADNGR